MRKLFLLALLPSLAWGQAITPAGAAISGVRPAINHGAGSSLALSLPFSTPGCYASGSAMGTKGEAVSITRASAATYQDASGTVYTCAAGYMRVGCDYGFSGLCGLLVEEARTNYALASATHPKSAEATASLPTGSYVAWHAGTGTLTLAAGTATVTGLSCSAVSAGTLCSFTVTAAGTMAITTTSGTTHVQVEPGTFRTSRIDTTTAAVARAADVVTVTNPLTNPARWCVQGTYLLEYGRAWTLVVACTGLFAFGANEWANNTVRSYAAPNDSTLQAYVIVSGAETTYSAPYTLAAGSPHTLQASYSGSASWRADGTTLTTTPNGSGGVPSAVQSAVVLGATPSTLLNGYLQNFRVYRSATCR